MKHQIKCIAAALFIAGSLFGCDSGPVEQPAPRAVMHRATPLPPGMGSVATMLIGQTSQFNSDVDRLPGATGEAHRQALHALLVELPNILTTANPSAPSPGFKNSLVIINAAAKTIDDSIVDRRRMEAVENQSLQAASTAFAEITSRYLYEDAQAAKLQQTLQTMVDAASPSVGPMHDLDATNAFVAMRELLNQISADYTDEFLRR